MYTKNLTVRELFQTFETARIGEFFVEGLRRENDGLAISALEELNRRGNSAPIWQGLKVASDEDLIRGDSTFAIALINALKNLNRAICPALRRYIKRISENGYIPLRQFMLNDEAFELLDDLRMEQNEGPQGSSGF